MLFDAALNFSGGISALGAFTGQAVNGAGSILSTNTVDAASLGLGGNPAQIGDLGASNNFAVLFHVLTAPTVGTSVRFQLVQADDPALSVNLQVVSQTDDIPIASLPAGAFVPLRWPSASPYPPKRYIGARYVNTGPIAGFTVFAAGTNDIQAMKTMLFRPGYTVA